MCKVLTTGGDGLLHIRAQGGVHQQDIQIDIGQLEKGENTGVRRFSLNLLFPPFLHSRTCAINGWPMLRQAWTFFFKMSFSWVITSSLMNTMIDCVVGESD